MIPVILALASAVASGPQMLPGMSVDQADYPKSALRMGRQGRVVFHVAVDTNGMPHNCTVTTPLDPELDARTCELVIARLRFLPAHSATGVAIDSECSSAVRWLINAHTPLKDHTSIITMTLAADGTIDKCVTDLDGIKGTLPTADCRKNLGRQISQITGDDLSNDATVTMIMTQRLGGPVAPEMGKYGKLRTSIGVDWTVNPDGSVGDCTVIENNVNGKPVSDPCENFKEYLSGPYEVSESGKPRGLGMGTYALVQPRVPDADEPRP